VSVTAWRITKRKHAKVAFSGVGARKYGGRWNSPGTTLVYVSETQSLAVLEILVHLEAPELLQRYVLIPAEIEERFIQDLDHAQLPRNWRGEPALAQLRSIGDQWVQSQTSAALRVPSVLVPAESNFLLNPAHVDFQRFVIGEPVEFSFDERFIR
jgi:RES domain-containing protein